MSDFKSKLPDLDELGTMASKLFGGIKKSVCEVIDDYKKKRAEEPTVQPSQPTPPVEPTKSHHSDDKKQS